MQEHAVVFTITLNRDIFHNEPTDEMEKEYIEKLFAYSGNRYNYKLFKIYKPKLIEILEKNDDVLTNFIEHDGIVTRQPGGEVTQIDSRKLIVDIGCYGCARRHNNIPLSEILGQEDNACEECGELLYYGNFRLEPSQPGSEATRQPEISNTLTPITSTTSGAIPLNEYQLKFQCPDCRTIITGFTIYDLIEGGYPRCSVCDSGSQVYVIPSGHKNTPLHGHNVWGEALTYRREAWIHDVSAGDTQRGYWSWVKAKMEESSAELASIDQVLGG